jgi:hypothetical protein
LTHHPPWFSDQAVRVARSRDCRGLRIIALVADEVEVRRRRPKETLLRFVKRLSWVQDQAPSSSAKPRPK